MSSNHARYKQYGSKKKKSSKTRTQAPTEEEKKQHQKITMDLLQNGFSEKDNPRGMAETTEFVVKFPVFREPYFKEKQTEIEAHLKERGISCKISFADGDVTVSTTTKTYDPYAIVKGRDFIRLIARGVAVDQSLKIFEDNAHYEVVPIWKYVYAKDVFTKRRKRLLGPDGETLKALEILTGTYVVIMGKTVAVIGNLDGVRKAVEVVVDCMKNVHPLHHIKRLMVLRELKNNPKMANEDWTQYLPEFKKKHHKKSKGIVKKKRSLKEELDHVFPESAPKSNVDKAIESGEYFMSSSQKQQYRNHYLEESNATAVRRKQEKLKKLHTAPKEQRNTAQSKNSNSTRDKIDAIRNRNKQDKKRKRKASEFIESKRRR